MIAVFAVLAGVCLGILEADTRIPRVRLVPRIATLLLIATGALSIFVLSPGNLLAALLYVFGALLGETVFSSLKWKQLLPESVRPSTIDLAVWTLVRPRQLRSLWLTFRPAQAHSPENR